ncbi:hypothetical protein ACCS88_21015 [Rhizobium ruizarguesonis]
MNLSDLYFDPLRDSTKTKAEDVLSSGTNDSNSTSESNGSSEESTTSDEDPSENESSPRAETTTNRDDKSDVWKTSTPVDISGMRPNDPFAADPRSQTEIGPTERALPWTDHDISLQPGGFAASFMLDFVRGCGKMYDNYSEMRSANVIGADKWFHCMGNCEATKSGLGGFYAANVVSVGREMVDVYFKNVALKGMTMNASVKDCREDLHSDFVGSIGGLSGTRCSTVCSTYRVNGL